MRCDRPPELRFSVTTSDPAVVFIRFYVGDKEVMGAGSPLGQFTNFHDVAVIQFQIGGGIVQPCDVTPGTQVDWIATATFQDGRVDTDEGRLLGTGKGLSLERS